MGVVEAVSGSQGQLRYVTPDLREPSSRALSYVWFLVRGDAHMDNS